MYLYIYIFISYSFICLITFCSVFYVFYEQYLTVVKDTWVNLLYCAGQFFLCRILTGIYGDAN